MAEKEYIEREAVLEIVKRTSGDYAAAFAEIRALPTADEQEVMACAEANLKYANDSLEILRQIHGKVSSPSDGVVPVVHGEWIVTKTEFGWNSAEYPTEYTCSVCGRTERQTEPYCHCGAKMNGWIEGRKAADG